MKTSFIVTILNEEQTIGALLDSITRQSQIPDEVIIVDGGSTDRTLSVISKQILKNKASKIQVITKKGNRSVGRNEGIRLAKGEIILISDAGCVLDKDWVKEITKPFSSKTVDVVAGYYRGKTETVFQKCLIPYVLVMPDKVNPHTFLPATRSMAIRKKVWEESGGFPEEYSNNEDYVFAKRLEREKKKIVFVKDAVVEWIPPKSVKKAFVMFYRFAIGDVQAGIWRTNVLILLLRILAAFYLVGYAFLTKTTSFTLFLLVLAVFYLLWAIWKNYKYVKHPLAVLFLPVWQLTADSAVFAGTSMAGIKKLSFGQFFSFFIHNKLLLMLLILYSVLVLSQLSWGVPNPSHPFTYHMDEWHQLMAVRGVFSQGSPNIAGAAHGPMFQFVLSGIYLVPFYLSGFINPFAIDSALTNLDLQGRLFEILRINTILFGIGSIIVFWHMVKRFLGISPIVSSLFFIFTPSFLLLSGYFKYDIALLFWILLALNSMLFYGKTQNFNAFIFAGVATGLALSTKISAAPLVFCYFVSYFLFTDKKNWQKKEVISGGIIAAFVTVVFGLPDIFVRWYEYYDHLYVNLVVVPSVTADFSLPLPVIPYLLTVIYPLLFGHVVEFSALLGMVLFLVLLRKRKVSDSKSLVFMMGSFVIFAISLFPLQLFASGNRALVLLPFFALFAGYFWQFLFGSRRNILRFLVFLGFVTVCFLQGFLIYAWMYIKYSPDPRAVSSVWLQHSFPKKTMIGMENIPIYQYVPDTVLKEYYMTMENPHYNARFSYAVIDAKTKQLPPAVIVTNNIEADLLNDSPKKRLLQRLEKEGYKHIKTFPVQVRYLHYFGSATNFYFTALVPTVSIDIYKR